MTKCVNAVTINSASAVIRQAGVSVYTLHDFEDIDWRNSFEIYLITLILYQNSSVTRLVFHHTTLNFTFKDVYG